MFGYGRPCLGVIIELHGSSQTSKDDEKPLLDDLWYFLFFIENTVPDMAYTEFRVVLEQLNERLPPYARILRKVWTRQTI